jgi:protoporphyrinogen oxidase
MSRLPPLNKHVVILGAGPAGLATAHELSSQGVQVTVLERNDYVGGLCRTVHDAGYKFDLGGHRWFTRNEHLNNWFRRLMDGELVQVQRTSRIYYSGKYYN